MAYDENSFLQGIATGMAMKGVNFAQGSGSGGGNFIIAEYEPSAAISGIDALYTDVRYLQASGTQYLNTEYVLQSTDKVYSKWYIPANTDFWQALYGARNNTYQYNAHNVFFRFWNESNFTYCRTGYETIVRSTIYDEIVEMESQNSTITINGTSYTASGTINNCVSPCGVFCLNKATSSGSFTVDSPCKAKMYEFKISASDNTIMRYLKPKIRNSDNKPGALDVNSGRFYVNAGSGEFGYEKMDGTYVAPT